jgi:hypothetical protein
MVALNSEFISFFCPSQYYLFYYWASDFLAGNLSDIYARNLSVTDIKYTTFHRYTGKYIVTGPMDDSVHFIVGYKTSSNEIGSSFFGNEYFFPERLAFDQAIFLVIGRFFGSGDNYYWIIGVFHPTDDVEEYYRYELMPNAIEMTETAENQTVRLLFTAKIDDNYLFKEIVDIDFRVSLFDFVSIGTNCGSVIRANDQIVAVSCPDYINSPLSVYTTGLVHLKTIEGLPINKFLHFYFKLI